MRIRDALESDAGAIAGLIGRPNDVVVDMIHDRSVRIAVDSGGNPGVEDTAAGDGGARSGANGGSEDEEAIDGFVAFDARSESVHVTDFAGSNAVVERLFEEPKRFAEREEMNVEVVVADEADDRVEAVEAAGFGSVGRGPRFEGRRTTRYRFDPDSGPEGL